MRNSSPDFIKTTFSMHIAGEINVVKDDCVGSCLVKLQSLLLSNLQITPIYCVLVNIPSILVHCNPGVIQVVLDFFVLIDAHWVDGCEEHRLPLFLETVTSRNQATLDGGV